MSDQADITGRDLFEGLHSLVPCHGRASASGSDGEPWDIALPPVENSSR